MNEKPIHLTGLNGLRAMAAISVMLSHVFQQTFGNWGVRGIKLPVFGGGVILFFVISGFLITFLLLQEVKKNKTVDIKRFYIRRILRIWPLYYGYILIAILLLFFCGLKSDILNINIWFYVFFTANIPLITGNGIWIIAHYWSIGVEEQFYLFWPWLIKISNKRFLFTALTVLVVWILLKYGAWIIFTKESMIFKFFSVTSFQSMMFGAIGAILYYNKNRVFLLLTTNKIIQIIAWMFFVVAWFFEKHIPAVFRNDIIAFFSLILVMEQVGTESKLINMENRFFDFIGKISYGIYVIHPLVIFVLSYFWRKSNLTIHPGFQYPIICFLTSVFTIILAYLSYYYYELPFLRFKDKFAVVNSKNSIN